MGFEFVFAYLENIWAISAMFSMIFGIVLILLIVFRITNDIDKDDWMYLMIYLTPMFLFFLFLALSPGMEHIKNVKIAINELYNPKVVDNGPETAVQLINSPQVGVNQGESK